MEYRNLCFLLDDPFPLKILAREEYFDSQLDSLKGKALVISINENNFFLLLFSYTKPRWHIAGFMSSSDV